MVIRDTVTAHEIAGQHAVVMGLTYKVLTGTEFPKLPGEVCCYCQQRDSCQALPGETYSAALLQSMADGIKV
jgi:hypothetical protein